MQKMIREVVCDCCGSCVLDLFGGYQVITLGGCTYDICNGCNNALNIHVDTWVHDFIDMFFENKEGRSIEDGDSHEEK